jgi:chromosome segregation ATPase
MAWNLNKAIIGEASVNTAEQVEKDKLRAEISFLTDQRNKLKDEIDRKIKEAFIARDEETVKKEREASNRLSDAETFLSDAQFQKNKVVVETKELKEKYDKYFLEIYTKKEELRDIQDKLSTLINYNLAKEKDLTERISKIAEMEKNIRDIKINLDDELSSAKKAGEYIESLKVALQADRDKLTTDISVNTDLTCSLNDQKAKLGIQEAEILNKEKSLEKAKLDFEDDVVSRGHDIKKEMESVKSAMDAIRQKEIELKDKQTDIDEQKKYLLLRERQIDDKIKTLKELRSAGGN